jgi:hypothetical protein
MFVSRMRPMGPARKVMIELLWIVGVIVLWFLLQRWILPKLGVST